MRIVIAVGGNALLKENQRGTWADQLHSPRPVTQAVVALRREGHQVVLTHGNGPQVGNLLVKNELSAAVVPPVPLDWCGAQTQATLGFILMDALDAALVQRGVRRSSATVVTRSLVDRNDPGFDNPTKPIGRYLPREEAEVLIEHGQHFEDRGERGWRRVVASPEPLEIVDAGAVVTLVEAGYVVIANGGGGIPVVRREDGTLGGVEAVIDKDLGAALLAASVDADRLVIATDIDHAVRAYGTDHAEPIGQVSVATMRTYAAEGHFSSGSMGPKVEAICRYVERSGGVGVITSLANIEPAVRGEAGTVVVPH